MRTVHCVTVTHGLSTTVAAMLESLSRTTRGLGREVSVTVVVQPDASGATASSELAPFAGWVDVVEPGANLGFGPANNLGASRSDSDAIALLNPDLELVEGWLEPLVSALAENDRVAIAAPPLLTSEGHLEEAGASVDSDGLTIGIGGGRSDVSYADAMRDRDVTYASAACWLVRRSAFEAVDGFDPAFVPAYYEDVDLALRLADAGQRCRLVTDRPVVHHHLGPDAGRAEIAERSRRLFVDRWGARLSQV